MNAYNLSGLLLFFAWTGCFFALGYMRGWTIGTRETEERWSEAVAKAEWHRKYGS